MSSVPSESSESEKSAVLDPHRVLAESAALAAHLERSGVQFLPQPNIELVGKLSDRFDVPAMLAPAAAPAAADAVSKAPAKPATPAPVKKARSATPIAKAVVDDIEVPYEGASLAEADRIVQLQQLNEQVSGCTLCSKLATCRTNTVFGEGTPTPRVAFFGEGPGADEDRTGRPFVGKAGQLLTKMIEACSFKREDVYILNTVKCRPPGNRNPEPEEIGNCRPFFEQQLSILRPEYIVCLGAVSSQALLNSKLSVGRLRGKFHRYFDSKVLVTYHPAYLLRNPAAKKAAWQDLQLMLRDAGIKI